MVGPDSDGIPRAPPYSGGTPEVHSLSLTGLSPSTAGSPNTIQLENDSLPLIPADISLCSLYPPQTTPADFHSQGLGSAPFAHHYSGHLFRFLFLRILRCFTSPGRPQLPGYETPPVRFPHSDIRGSLHACCSPRLLAACCVLLRRMAPQASPACPLYLNLIYLI